VNPDAYLVGEIWDGAGRWLRGDTFDGVMNYPLTRAIFGLVGRTIDHKELSRSGLNGIAPLDTRGFADAAGRLLTAYPPEAVAGQLNLLGSHDTPRLLTSLGGDVQAARQALVLLFALPGAPCVYYGDELGLAGGHDPHCRQAMPWDAQADHDAVTLELVRSLARVRADSRDLRRGATEVIAHDQDVVAVRRGEQGAVTVLLNLADEGRTVSNGTLPAGRYRDLLRGETLMQGELDSEPQVGLEARGWQFVERLD
jgi:neopullulanase